MASPDHAMIDGNEAVARIAYLTNEVVSIYPITPASPMGEWADEWATQDKPNLWGTVPHVTEMQSEGGAAGAIHGALQSGAVTTTFTASQGLLLMLPNMYKIAGELTPTVFHVASRTVASHALSIFGDHSDVMAARATGFGLLASASVQEAHDFTLIAQNATLHSRVPLVHFFDGFRTSHELNKTALIDDATVRAMIPDEAVLAHLRRGLSPEDPAIRGTSQNPDVFFQGREAANPFYEAAPGMVQAAMDHFAELTGRQYRLFDYHGHPEAERVVVLMGSGAETAADTVRHLSERGEKVGTIQVRLYRPFDADALMAALPATTRRIGVLDRTKEAGADGEPLYKDVAGAILDRCARGASGLADLPRVVGGRYGLSGKELTPGMVRAVLDELERDAPRNPITVGIQDDIGGTSVDWDADFRTDTLAGVTSAVFYGLGSDGTVSANKNSIKIIGEETDQHAQGYFVYDSRKAGAVTVSHLRFGGEPIRAPYLVGAGEAHFVACHQSSFLQRYDMLDYAAEDGIFLLNAPEAPDEVWATLPRRMQQQIIDKRLRFYTIDAYTVANETGMGGRINTIMQTCFFAISGVLPRDEAISRIKEAVEKTYGRKGRRIVEKNFAAIDTALANLHEVPVPDRVTTDTERPPAISPEAPEFVREVEGAILAGHGDQVPVSQMPVDGTFPVGTARYEKRNIAQEVPVWNEDICIQCGKCVVVCPHATIREKAYPESALAEAPEGFRSLPAKGKGFPEDYHVTYQVAPEDCTGCTLCVAACPARDKSNPKRKALEMAPQPEVRDREAAYWAFFRSLPEYDRTDIRWQAIPEAMLGEPLFEFSSACTGCGETPYIRLATQLFGDRMMIANATGCSSIYGGNLPTTPYTTDAEGRGPVWNNSLFEDNAEFGFGFRLAVDKQREQARELVARLREDLDDTLVDGLLAADQSSEAGIQAQRERVAQLRETLAGRTDPQAAHLHELADALIHRSIWLVGGDGWAFDIGYGGLDHVLAAGRDVNILVLDTEVYSNTGGQTSKATPKGAVAKFSVGGKTTTKKDLSLLAMDHDDVYVAQVAVGARDKQTIQAFLEAEAHPGPSIIIAYSPCIAHGVDLAKGIEQQELAVRSGHWPLLRHDPKRIQEGKNPIRLDSKEPDIPYSDFAKTETRFSLLQRTHPEAAAKLMTEAQHEVTVRFHRYQQLAGLSFEEEAEADEEAT